MARPWRPGNIVNASALDRDVTTQAPFPRLINSPPDETVVLTWIAFKSRAPRDEVNAKVMKDSRLAKTDPNEMPFDCKRMTYGGFEVLVDAIAPVPDKSSVLRHDRSQTR